MALVDSRAAFEAHCDKIDSTGALKALMSSNSLQTFSELSFAIGTPQNPPTDVEFKDFCKNLNGGADMEIALLARVRRLHFEASTLVVAHLKSQVNPETGLDVVKKIPPAEKQARLLEQQKRLTGLTLTGELLPSHALIDQVAAMVESNTVLWIPPSKCSKRDDEVQLLGKQKAATLSLEQQTLKITPADTQVSVDLSTELQLQWALQRRGLALDQCGLITWNTHQKWVQQLLNLLTKEAPTGFNKIRIDQLIQADKELFTVMAQEFQMSDKKLSDTPAPMEVAMKALCSDPRITMHVLPLPKSIRASSSIESEDKGDTGLKRQQPKKKAKAGPSAKAKALCPPELRAYKQLDHKGRAICWAFNMKDGCHEPTNSEGRCKKGMHICIKCQRNNHSLASCRVKAA